MNLKVLVITFENDFFARSYVEDTNLTWPLLIDETHRVYQAYGMLKASFMDVWGLKTWGVYLRELYRGQKLVQSKADIYQRGGDVLIDPDGIVRLHHVGQGPADRPAVESVLAKVKELA